MVSAIARAHEVPGIIDQTVAPDKSATANFSWNIIADINLGIWKEDFSKILPLLGVEQTAVFCLQFADFSTSDECFQLVMCMCGVV